MANLGLAAGRCEAGSLPVHKSGHSACRCQRFTVIDLFRVRGRNLQFGRRNPNETVNFPNRQLGRYVFSGCVDDNQGIHCRRYISLSNILSCRRGRSFLQGIAIRQLAYFNLRAMILSVIGKDSARRGYDDFFSELCHGQYTGCSADRVVGRFRGAVPDQAVGIFGVSDFRLGTGCGKRRCLIVDKALNGTRGCQRASVVYLALVRGVDCQHRRGNCQRSVGCSGNDVVAGLISGLVDCYSGERSRVGFNVFSGRAGGHAFKCKSLNAGCEAAYALFCSFVNQLIAVCRQRNAGRCNGLVTVCYDEGHLAEVGIGIGELFSSQAHPGSAGIGSCRGLIPAEREVIVDIVQLVINRCGVSRHLVFGSVIHFRIRFAGDGYRCIDRGHRQLAGLSLDRVVIRDISFALQHLVVFRDRVVVILAVEHVLHAARRLRYQRFSRYQAAVCYIHCIVAVILSVIFERFTCSRDCNRASRDFEAAVRLGYGVVRVLAQCDRDVICIGIFALGTLNGVVQLIAAHQAFGRHRIRIRICLAVDLLLSLVNLQRCCLRFDCQISRYIADAVVAGRFANFRNARNDLTFVYFRVGLLAVQRDARQSVIALQAIRYNLRKNVLSVDRVILTLESSVVGVFLRLRCDRQRSLLDRQISRYIADAVVAGRFANFRNARNDLTFVYFRVGLLAVQRDARQSVIALQAYNCYLFIEFFCVGRVALALRFSVVGVFLSLRCNRQSCLLDRQCTVNDLANYIFIIGINRMANCCTADNIVICSGVDSGCSGSSDSIECHLIRNVLFAQEYLVSGNLMPVSVVRNRFSVAVCYQCNNLMLHLIQFCIIVAVVGRKIIAGDSLSIPCPLFQRRTIKPPVIILKPITVQYRTMNISLGLSIQVINLVVRLKDQTVWFIVIFLVLVSQPVIIRNFNICEIVFRRIEDDAELLQVIHIGPLLVANIRLKRTCYGCSLQPIVVPIDHCLSIRSYADKVIQGLFFIHIIERD